VWQHIVRPSWRSAWPQLPVSSWVPRAPGVGKTTLVEKGIAKALGLPYNARPRRSGRRLYAGAQLHGQPRSHCGGFNAARSEPVLFFDELDKVSESPRKS
jgi:ATP-dependent Lon protease